MYDKVSELSKILDELKSKMQFKSDNEIANFLNVAPKQISVYRKGIQQPCNERCLKIAITLGKEPDYVISAADMDRARRKGETSLWEVFRKAKTTISGVIFAILAVSSLCKTADTAKTVRSF